MNSNKLLYVVFYYYLATLYYPKKIRSSLYVEYIQNYIENRLPKALSKTQEKHLKLVIVARTGINI